MGQPISQNAELFRSLIEHGDFSVKLSDLQRSVNEGVRPLLEGSYPGVGDQLSSIFRLSEHSRSAYGVKLSLPGMASANLSTQQLHMAYLEIREDGGLRYYDAYIGERISHPRLGDPYLGLYLDRVLTTVREILEAALVLSNRYGFVGAWQLGVAITGIQNARTIPSMPNRGVPGPIGPHGYTRESYGQVNRASTSEVQLNPGRVTERLLGRLHRSMVTGTPLAFTDPVT